MITRKKIFFDIDGTLNDFKSADSYIINEIFKGHVHVLLFDKLLWKINDLDILSNTMFLFKIRILVYSVLSFTSFSENLRKYQDIYQASTIKDLEKSYVYLEELRKLGYEISLLTHNQFTAEVEGIDIKILKNKQKYISDVKSQIAYMIGNNYMEDLRKSIKYGIKTIYIGNSKLVKALVSKKALAFSNLEDAVEYIMKENG